VVDDDINRQGPGILSPPNQIYFAWLRDRFQLAAL
jgi:hypothetical protein